ncbi:Nuclease sbcCD subunit D [Salmonella enterica subsp. enterica]|uniref:Nuclease sbcCD subunit D n=1 Tax=Salmonella enterica I TaxID=59201 RepID=A0A3S4HZB3_SALET|nr:Nuclease sbcCD subunit D [Salmonella enterica subsp. enterica]
MPLLSLAIFLIPVRRQAMPENFINRFVVNLQQTGCHLVVLAGNHDSVATLNESARHFWRFSIQTVIASAGYAPRLLHRRDGSPGAVLCPIPFLRPRDIITSQAGLSGSEKTAATSSCDCRLLSTAVSGSVPATRRNESCRLSRRDI